MCASMHVHIHMFRSVAVRICTCTYIHCVVWQVSGDGEVKELAALTSGMSARERNRAKRKARQLARRNSREKDTPDKVLVD